MLGQGAVLRDDSLTGGEVVWCLFQRKLCEVTDSHLDVLQGEKAMFTMSSFLFTPVASGEY